MKEWNKAAKAMRIALDGLSRSPGKEHKKTLQCTHELGSLLATQGDNAEAETLFRNLVEVRKRTAGPDHWDTVQSIYELGCVLMKQETGRNEAGRLMSNLLEKEKQGVKIPAETSRKQAELLYHQDRLKEAEGDFDKVIGVWTSSRATHDAELLEAQDFLGRALYKQGKFARATTIFEGIVNQRKEKLGEEHELTIQARRRYRKALLH